MKIFSIEGPIGVGKSTLLHLLKDCGFSVYPEPIEEWEPWLQHFYTTEKTAKDSIQLQTQIGHSIARRMESILQDGKHCVIMERSLQSGLHIFTKVNRELTPDPRWDEVEQLYKDLILKWETETEKVKLFYIALNCCNFETVYERSKLRGGPDSFVQANYHKLIYQRSQQFHDRCDEIINFNESDKPAIICQRVTKTIKKYI